MAANAFSRNLIHASDSFDSATKEIGLWFGESELAEYKVSNMANSLNFYGANIVAMLTLQPTTWVSLVILYSVAQTRLFRMMWWYLGKILITDITGMGHGR